MSRMSVAAAGLGALGVVYGDIGTSPLYALRECLGPRYGVAPIEENVLGLLSLIFWSLTLIVVVKYIGFVLRADNRGEGGILSLMALAVPPDKVPGHRWSRRGIVTALGLFGAALLLGEGMITPAISVLSAVEGLELTAPSLSPAVVPITLVILGSLFLVQKRGTGFVGALFGPVMFIWFLVIGGLGLVWIIREPSVLAAVNPLRMITFFQHHQLHGFLVLGAVVLCVTGTEALYADLGHFGRHPIRAAWFSVVFPSLLLNYFGQGAVVIAKGQAAAVNPFYLLAGDSMQYPLIALATVATVIASQSLISGSFSLAQQAVQLGYSPRLTVVHTSSRTKGQIYMPEVNGWLAIACCGLVLAFKKSSNLAAAYGVVVIGTMTITSLMLFVVAYRRWNWGLPKAAGLAGVFLAVDLTFLTSNLSKLWEGAWLPLVTGIVLFTLMTTWKRGRGILSASIGRATLPLQAFIEPLERGQKPLRVPGTAVFMTSNPDGTPLVLMHHYKHNKMLHEQVILLSVSTLEVPSVAMEQRVRVVEHGHGFFSVRAFYGYMQTPRVPDVFHCCRSEGLKVDPRRASFYLGRESLITTTKPGMSRWRKAVFAVMSRNAISAVAYFDIPPDRVVELGTQIEL
ncbi:MAG TPA: potassium transporter Kup [Phycisphaerae bacterium]|nr:potassium transporter Kup [Phycisphaerae bacterium]HRY70727.1 potassium transporter Kup [Phycisphaerae bacterium]HSA28761.1 potassium transporter Kup [Phycisphaerae bacterium]